MGEQRQLRCLIAAGGTVGHVAPSLAVAEALRARGVEVTFAGSPDRVEARLVPERGYAFDAFRVAGFPRRPGPQLLRALVLAAAAPLACLRILARRQPDVVLGGGGYVGGPMVLAAWLRRIPAALTEADAHLGLANRLAIAVRAAALPRVSRSERRTRRRASSDGRSRRARTRSRASEARRELGLPQDGPVVLVFGGSQGARTLNEMAVDAWGEGGPAVLHLTGERDYDELRGRVTRDGLPAASVHRRLRRRACGRRPRRLARRRLGVGDRGGRDGRRSSCRIRTRRRITSSRMPSTSSVRAVRVSCPTTRRASRCPRS